MRAGGPVVSSRLFLLNLSLFDYEWDCKGPLKSRLTERLKVAVGNSRGC